MHGTWAVPGLSAAGHGADDGERTLVVGRAARAAKAHIAHVCAVAVAVAVGATVRPAGYGHGRVAVCTGHGCGRGRMAEIGRRTAGDSGGIGGEGGGGGGRTELVGEGAVLEGIVVGGGVVAARERRHGAGEAARAVRRWGSRAKREQRSHAATTAE